MSVTLETTPLKVDISPQKFDFTNELETVE